MNQRQILGRKLEQSVSTQFHLEGVPLLISSNVLRKRNAGQVDLARMMRKGDVKWIQILEVKSTGNVSFGQRARLKTAAQFIGAVLKLPVELKFSLRTNRES